MDDVKPSELQYRSFVSEVRAVEDEPMTVVATISTDSVDRMGDVIEQDGWDLSRYKKNPVVLWAHDHAIPPVGKAVDVRLANGRLKATTKFADTTLGREVFNLYRGGFLSAFSVGFKPVEWKPIKDSDGNVRGFRFLKQELLEYSAVAVPANPDATVEVMRQMVARGMLTECVRYLPAAVTRDAPDRVSDFCKSALERLERFEEYPAIRRLLAS